MIRKLLFTGVFLLSLTSMAQIDKSNPIRIEGLDFKLDTTTEKTNNKFNFELKVPTELQFSNAKPNLSDLPPPNQKQNNTPGFLQQQQETNNDMLHVRYWNGQDITNRKMETTQELGTINTTSRKLRIECRDHSFVDGDRVRVFLNEKVVYNNIVLKGNYFTINLDLQDGFNRVDIQALNQGTSGPNTAEFLVFDEHGRLISTKEWNMLTGNVSTLVVIKN